MSYRRENYPRNASCRAQRYPSHHHGPNHHQQTSTYQQNSHIGEANDTERNVYKKGGDLKIRISNDEVKVATPVTYNSRATEPYISRKPYRNGVPESNSRKRFRRSQSPYRHHNSHAVKRTTYQRTKQDSKNQHSHDRISDVTSKHHTPLIERRSVYSDQSLPPKREHRHGPITIRNPSSHKSSSRPRQSRSCRISPTMSSQHTSYSSRNQSRTATGKRLPTLSDSSSGDEKILRLKLLKDKYSYKNDYSVNSIHLDKLNNGISSTHNRTYIPSPISSDHIHRKRKYANNTSRVSPIRISSSELSTRSTKSDCDGKAFHFISDRSGTSSRVITPKQSTQTVLYERKRLPSAKGSHQQHIRQVYKPQQKQEISSSSSSDSSSSSSSSSSPSPIEKHSDPQKRSKWNSGSSDEHMGPLRKHLANCLPKSRPIAPPLADKSILKDLKLACPESMFRQRNCKFCALNLKTKDDVRRHVLSERHRVVTGEYFIENAHLIKSPYPSDRIHCVTCNACIGFNVVIARHEDSTQHRMRLTRWIARNQPKPPIKYYIEP